MSESTPAKPSEAAEEPNGSNGDTIHLYAELLLHIRSISLTAVLQTHSNHTTKAILSADRTSLTLSHEGRSATIRLPTALAGGGDVALTLPPTSSKELTLRLRLEEKAPGSLLPPREELEGNWVPWSASALGPATEVSCASCGAVWVPRGAVPVWKDLPNENWAEMMEFWHCHKPDHHHPHQHQQADVGSTKGYAAGSKVRARKGEGFVDLAWFLVDESDCVGLKTRTVPLSDETNKTKKPEIDLLCNRCDAPAGVLDPLAEGYRLFKWACGLRTSTDSPPETHDMQKWIAAQLLAAVENDGVRRFIVRDRDRDREAPAQGAAETEGKKEEKEEADEEAIHLWLFTPDLRISSARSAPPSSAPTSHHPQHPHNPTRAAKIFWRPLRDRNEADAHSATVEELRFPSRLYEALRRVLRGSAQERLPPSASRFREWRVGVVERFEGRVEGGFGGGDCGGRGGEEKGGEVRVNGALAGALME